MIIESTNRGLSTNFSIQDGKFLLTGGVPKSKDNVSLFIKFAGKRRIYYQDFCTDVGWIWQKPTSWISLYKNIILSRFLSSAEKYLTYCEVVNAIVVYSFAERKKFGLAIQWLPKLPDSNEVQTITFLG